MERLSLPASSRTSASKCGRARSSGSAGSSARGRTDVARAIFGDRTRPQAAALRFTASRPIINESGRRDRGWVSPSCPRTARSPGYSGRFRSSRTSPPPSRAGSRLAASSGARSRSRWRSESVAKLRIRLASPATAHRRALGRQPAEGDSRALAPDRSLDPDPGRADARHRHRRQGRVLRHDRRAGRGGRAILLISSELPELLALCDRVLVMSEGRLTANLAARRSQPRRPIMHAAVPAARRAGSGMNTAEPHPAASRGRHPRDDRAVLPWPSAPSSRNFLTLDSLRIILAARAADPDRRDGRDACHRRPACRPFDRLDSGFDGDGGGHDVPLPPRDLVAARLRRSRSVLARCLASSTAPS